MTLRIHNAPHKQAKVRFVAQEYGDREKPLIVHDFAALTPASIWLILLAASAKQFRLFSHNVSQAYLESKYELPKCMYIQPTNENLKTFGLGPNQSLKFLKPLQGLCKPEDY